MESSRLANIKDELIIKATRSQGPGGQNVNKVNSRVEIRFRLWESTLFSYSEKLKIAHYLQSRMTREGEILIVSQSSRSQLQNKQEATSRLIQLIQKALTPVRKRRATRPTRGSILKRLESKKRHSEKKRLRNQQDF